MTELENFKPIEKYEMTEMEYIRFFTMSHFWSGTKSQNEFYRLSKETIAEDNPNAYVEEKNCAGHIVRKVGKGIYKIHTIRDDGTVWTIDLRAYKEVTPLEVWMVDRLNKVCDVEVAEGEVIPFS